MALQALPIGRFMMAVRFVLQALCGSLSVQGHPLLALFSQHAWLIGAWMPRC